MNDLSTLVVDLSLGYLLILLAVFLMAAMVVGFVRLFCELIERYKK